MKLALIQFNSEWDSKNNNLQRAVYFVKKAAFEKCDVVVFPEMFNTGFSMNIASIAEEKNGETYQFLSNLAKCNNIHIIAGLACFTSFRKKGQNMAMIFDRKGDLIAKYVKLHPFCFTHEDDFFVAGNNIVHFKILGMPSSIFICYDLRFPEVFRNVAKSIQTVFVIANWPDDRIEHWTSLLKARAIENQCYIIGVNRTGKDGNGLTYSGHSQVFDPWGRKLCNENNENEFLTCEINPELVTSIRNDYPFLQDMRF